MTDPTEIARRLLHGGRLMRDMEGAADAFSGGRYERSKAGGREEAPDDRGGYGTLPPAPHSPPPIIDWAVFANNPVVQRCFDCPPYCPKCKMVEGEYQSRPWQGSRYTNSTTSSNYLCVHNHYRRTLQEQDCFGCRNMRHAPQYGSPPPAGEAAYYHTSANPGLPVSSYSNAYAYNGAPQGGFGERPAMLQYPNRAYTMPGVPGQAPRTGDPYRTNTTYDYPSTNEYQANPPYADPASQPFSRQDYASEPACIPHCRVVGCDAYLRIEEVTPDVIGTINNRSAAAGLA